MLRYEGRIVETGKLPPGSSLALLLIDKKSIRVIGRRCTLPNMINYAIDLVASKRKSA